MESLVAHYASSEEEQEEEHQQQQSTSSSSSSTKAAASSLFSSLPRPKSSPLFSSIPQPQQPPHRNPISKSPIGNNFEDDEQEQANSEEPTSDSNKSSSSSIFSLLPQPKSQNSQPFPVEKSTKRVVQFRPPPIRYNNFGDEDKDEGDDKEEEEKERKRRNQSQFFNQNSSVKSFLSSIPVPKSSATLGVFPSSSGSGRKSIIDTEAPTSSFYNYGAKDKAGNNQNMFNDASYDVGGDQNVNLANYELNVSQTVESYATYEVDSDQNLHTSDASGYVDYSSYQLGVDQNALSGDASGYVNYGSNVYGNYNNGYGDYRQSRNVVTMQESAGVVESSVKMKGKRGRNEIPAEIVEVKQDELIKDRPREDQVKLTGIAFGPSYQPAPTKGKPSKLHKRKHQISSLYFDMKQKEMELAERRSRGLLTKAQTQGKYGW